MNGDFFLNDIEVEASLQKLMKEIEEENTLIERFSNLTFQELTECYQSDRNSNIENIASLLINRLNKGYKEKIDHWMFLRQDKNEVMEIKRQNLENMTRAESEIIK